MEFHKGRRVNISIANARVVETYESRTVPPSTVLVAVVDGSPSNERSMAINLHAPEVTVRPATEARDTVNPPPVEPWDVAVKAVCESLVSYAEWRRVSGDLDACARMACISATTAARFEDLLDVLSAADDTEDDATPGADTPGVAEAPTQ